METTLFASQICDCSSELCLKVKSFHVVTGLGNSLHFFFEFWTASVPVNICDVVCIHRSEIHFHYSLTPNCFPLLSIWLFISGCSLWSNPNALTDCSAFILRIMFMIICLPPLESAFLACVSLLSSFPTSWIPLCCSKFSCVHSVCSILMLFIWWLCSTRDCLKCCGCRRAEFNCDCTPWSRLIDPGMIQTSLSSHGWSCSWLLWSWVSSSSGSSVWCKKGQKSQGSFVLVSIYENKRFFFSYFHSFCCLFLPLLTKASPTLAAKSLSWCPWPTPTQPWLLLLLQSPTRVSVGTAGAAPEDTGAVCRGSEGLSGKRGSFHIPAGSGKQQNNLCHLSCERAGKSCSSPWWVFFIFHRHTGSPSEAFSRGFFLKLSHSLLFVCLYFSLNCWSVISFLTPGALSAELWASDSLSSPRAVPAGGRSELLHTLVSLSPVKWPEASSENLLWAEVSISSLCEGVCTELFCTCSNLPVRHPQLPERFCEDLVLWSAQLLCLKSQTNVKPN